MNGDDVMELKIDRKLSLFIFVGVSFIFGCFIYNTYSSTHYEHHFGYWLIAAFFCLLFLLGLYFMFDKSVQVRINSDGIFWSDNFFNREKVKELYWNEVQSCYLADNTSKGVQDLTLTFTNKSNKEFKLGLSAYDKPWQEIYQKIEKYSKEYKFGFLGIESLK